MKLRLRNFLTFLTVALMVTSCTEQISEEVKNSEVLSAEEQEIAKFENKAIRLVDKSNSDLDYILHKQGTLEEACELDAPTLGFSSKDYDKSSSSYTVDCILDAQEFDLFFNGVDLEVQVDEFLCEYVSYKSYRFYQYQPGETSQKQYDINCDAVCSAAYPTVCGNKYSTIDLDNTSLSPTGAGDLKTFNPGDPTLANLFSGQITDIEPLQCQYDYSNASPIAGPNCDSGSIATVPIYLTSTSVDTSSCSDPLHTTEVACVGAGETWTVSAEDRCDDSTSAATYPSMLIDNSNITLTECGGDRGNCLAGPATDAYPNVKTGLITQNTDLDDFKMNISIEAPYDKNYFSNMYIANFSRICSSTSLTKSNAQFDTSLNSIIGHEVEDMPSRTAYTTIPVDADGNGEFDYTPHATHLFNGAGPFSRPTYNVQPYYAIRCLDKAYDIKAQIRLFIRDWDKSFDSNNGYISRLSDINQSNPLMDADGDQADGEIWNDLNDLDDLLGDIDLNKSSDYNGDSDNIDNLFTSNQCTGLDYGRCFEYMTLTEVACPGSGGTWYGDSVHGYCIRNLPALTNQAVCEAADSNYQWTTGHCENSTYHNQTDCEANGEAWFDSQLPFPGQSL